MPSPYLPNQPVVFARSTLLDQTITVTAASGIGTPEAVVTANPGAVYMDLNNPSLPVRYVKKTGAGNTGWIAS